ncbi:efflux RND transporter periplasmic adaptor subunit [Uliginosibacterium gangwonense]|uniref:efflux RND transporter periplasmic adaptor subunit n=1 Tax=Uliginosibacterium gangwonense TaxID=392736 RepID=UPI0003A9EE62|nr:efflux RND transporter periplasmic adaptor subunit [Uliginosibacterium gangwonense]
MKLHLTLLVCVSALLTTTWLTGCSRNSTPPPETPRVVKLETVATDRSNATTHFIAQVRQEQRAELGFETSGHIESIRVEVGDQVRQGEVLARLDPEPGKLRLEQAEANLEIAVAELKQQQAQASQQQHMFEDGAVSATTLTSVKTALATAQARYRSAQSERELARRGVRQMEIRAPFGGSVVARLQMPDANIAAGQPVLQLEGERHPQVIALLPSDLVAQMHIGQEVHAYRSNMSNQPFPLRLRSVAQHIDGGATVQTIFDSAGAAATGLHSGENLLLALPRSDEDSLSVPLSALVPGANSSKTTVFVYQKNNATVHQRQVITDNIVDDRVHIRLGLSSGEQIVAAGAAFLTDGQSVVPFSPDTRLTSNATP